MYVCPKCHGALKETPEGFMCASCGTSYRFYNGVPVFFPPSQFDFGLLSSDMDRSLLELAKHEGYSSVLRELRENMPHVYSRVANQYVSTYLWLLRDLGRVRRCLEIGFGYGALAVLLSKYCDEVYAVDVSAARAELLRYRAEYEGADNIAVAVADATHLPFPNDYFDAVFMVGVLEWIPLSHEGNPRDVQLQALGEIHRVLRPGGELLVGIENRFGAQYFAGWRDHNGLRFTSILPRGISDIISRVVLGKSYRTYTYSYWGYNHLFTEAGFDTVDIFLALKSYRFPRFAINLESEDVRYFFRNVYLPPAWMPSVLRRLAGAFPVFLHRFFAPHFIVRARKGEGS